MARIDPLWTAEPLTETSRITEFLAERGVTFEVWPLSAEAQRLAAQATLSDADKQSLLDCFSHQLADKAQRYKSADVIAIRPELPGLDDALARFDKVHFHDDDEVRAIVGGRGVFGFVGDDGRQFLLTVEAGEYISVPAGTWHWFYCLDDRNITALRLFEDTAGWVPHYRSTDRGVPHSRAS